MLLTWYVSFYFHTILKPSLSIYQRTVAPSSSSSKTWVPPASSSPTAAASKKEAVSAAWWPTAARCYWTKLSATIALRCALLLVVRVLLKERARIRRRTQRRLRLFRLKTGITDKAVCVGTVRGHSSYGVPAPLIYDSFKDQSSERILKSSICQRLQTASLSWILPVWGIFEPRIHLVCLWPLRSLKATIMMTAEVWADWRKKWRGQRLLRRPLPILAYLTLWLDDRAQCLGLGSSGLRDSSCSLY